MKESLERGPNRFESKERLPENGPEKIKEDFPTLTIRIMRHSIKGKLPEGVTDDKLTPLSTEGRELAAKKFEKPINIRFAHVEGSPRKRTLQTAAAAATGNPNANPEDLGIGKARIDEALDFNVGDNEYSKSFMAAYKKEDVLSFLVNDSDALAKNTGDTESSTYSRSAANIASIIDRNYRVATRGAAILEQSKNPDNDLSNDFERIMVTHATVPECFLLKVIEKTQGTVERDALMKTIGGSGFSETEGFDITFSKEGDAVQVRVAYTKGDYTFDKVVPIDVIEEIVEEGK